MIFDVSVKLTRSKLKTDVDFLPVLPVFVLEV